MMRIYKYLQRIVYLFAALALPLVARAQIEDVRAAFDTRHLVAYVVAAFLMSIFIMLFYNRLYYFREKQVSQDTAQMNAQLAMILESSKTETWTYDVNKIFSSHYALFSAITFPFSGSSASRVGSSRPFSDFTSLK